MTIGKPPPVFMTTLGPNDPNWTLPSVATDEWAESPDILPPGYEDHERFSIRAANHAAFKSNGNTLDWLHYVLFGFYLYDDVRTFAIEWKDAKKTKQLLSYFIWNTYHQYRMKSIAMPLELQHWATTLAKPFLQHHDPDIIYATTLDFENTIHDQDQNKAADAEVWTEIRKSGKKVNGNKNPGTPTTSPTGSVSDNAYILSQPEQYYSSIQNDDLDEDEEFQFSPTVNYDDEEQIMEEAVQGNLDDRKVLNPTPVTKNSHRPHSHITQPVLTSISKNKRNPMVAIRLSKTKTAIRNPYSQKTKRSSGIFSYKKKVTVANTLLATKTPDTSPKQTKTVKPTSTEMPSNNPTPEEDSLPKSQHRTKNPNLITQDEISQFSAPSAFQHSSNPFIAINDGTQRLTIRWKTQEKFGKQNEDPKVWDDDAANMIHNLFHIFAEKINVLIWEDKKSDTIGIEQLSPKNLRKYLSPKISALPSTQSFIFGIRICAGANIVGSWLNNEHTRLMLTTNEVEVSLSNAKCTSGNVVQAGCILFKHPIYTHRLYYLLSMRKNLPENTPFFDLAIHRRTHHGDEIPHLVIKCGEHHVQGLTDILASHLDGKTTAALFVPQPAIKSMTEEEIRTMFNAHHRVIDGMQRLSLYPRVVNIDRKRSEKYSGEQLLTRTTREWANSLLNADGSHMRCDAENGGSDRKAYLIVPEENVNRAKEELHKYLSALQAGQYSSGKTSHNESTDDTPREIYIPSQAVRANLDFLKHFTTAAEVWKNAPAAVRHTIPTKSNNLPLSPKTPTDQTTKHQQPPSQSPDTNRVHAKPTNVENSSESNGTQPSLNQQTKGNQRSPERTDDYTIGTIASTVSKTTTFSTHANRFQELEAQIKFNHQAYESANQKIDTLQDQMVKTMEVCAASSLQISNMRTKLNECASANQVNALSLQVRDLTNAMTLLLQQIDIPHPTTSIQSTNNLQPNSIHPLATPTQSAESPANTNTTKRPLTQTPTSNEDMSHNTMEDAVSVASLLTKSSNGSVQSVPTPSPEKKKPKIKPRLANDDQEPSAQYTTDRTPDALGE